MIATIAKTAALCNQRHDFSAVVLAGRFHLTSAPNQPDWRLNACGETKTMVSKSYIEFAPSHRTAPDAARHGAVPADEPVEVSLYLKPRGSIAGLARTDVAHHRAALHKDDLLLIREFAHANSLKITAEEPARRLIKLAGPAAAMQAAFKVELAHYGAGKTRFRGRTGALSLPEDVAAIVESVLGLDTRPAAAPRLVMHRAKAAADTSFLPNAVAKLYHYPTNVTGAGQCIALIELGGGYNTADTQAAFTAMGLKPPTVIAIPIDGAANKPSPDDGADGEVALDIQIAGGAAPGAKIAVYFAPNTDAGFVDAITAAAQDTTNKPTIMSISWGGPESTWSAQGLTSMTSALQDAASLHLSVFVAAGDNLATDGVTDGAAHVDFPASSPWAIGCGGTHITVAGGAITAESVWNNGTSGTGGGVSAVYPVPEFQAHTKIPVSVSTKKPGRGVPDVAGNGDPNSGYIITVNGQSQVYGGTSAVAPLWAGLAALINQKAATPAGFFLPTLYATPHLTNDITTGNNKPANTTTGYTAQKGWDPCTGLGSPNGTALFNALTGVG
jgi:kumamolisin